MTTDTIKVKIITPNEVMFDGEASLVTMPGEEGVFGVMPMHMQLVANLKPGLVTINSIHATKKYFVYKGIAQVNCGEECANIVTDYAVDIATVNPTQIDSEINILRQNFAKEQDQYLKTVIQNSIDKLEFLISCLH